MREDGDELILLSVLLQQALLCAFQLPTLVQLAQARQLSKQALTHLAPISLGIFEEQSREFLVFAQQLRHVLFGADFRVQHRPVVGGANEGKAASEELVAPGAKDMEQGSPGFLAACRLREHHCGASEDRILEVGSFRQAMRRARRLAHRGGHRSRSCPAAMVWVAEGV